MSKFATALSVFVALGIATSAMAQPVVNGPPMDPQQVFQAQPKPMAPPPPPIAVSPPGPSGTILQARPGGEARTGVASDRVARCQHQASVDRIPRSKRGAYINNCIRAD
jgi:hypothetical protein